MDISQLNQIVDLSLFSLVVRLRSPVNLPEITKSRPLTAMDFAFSVNIVLLSYQKEVASITTPPAPPP